MQFWFISMSILCRSNSIQRNQKPGRSTRDDIFNLRSLVEKLACDVEKMYESPHPHNELPLGPVLDSDILVKSRHWLSQGTVLGSETTVISRKEDNLRKFNVVLYGIPEQSPGTSRHRHTVQDCQSIDALTESVNIKVSVQDCHRLEKFQKNHPKPRPLLVKLNCVSDVNNNYTPSQTFSPW